MIGLLLRGIGWCLSEVVVNIGGLFFYTVGCVFGVVGNKKESFRNVGAVLKAWIIIY